MHQPVGRNRGIPRVGLIDTLRIAIGAHKQVFRALREAQRRTSEGCHGPDAIVLAGGLVRRRCRTWKRWLIAEAARTIDRAQDDLQDVDQATGLEPVRVRRDTAHRVHRHGTAGRLLVPAPMRVGPWNVEFDLLLEGCVGKFGGNPLDRRCWNAGFDLSRLGRVLCTQIPLGDQLKRRPGGAPIGELEVTHQCWRDIGQRRVDQRI